MMRANRKLVLGLLGSGVLVGMSLWAQSPAPTPTTVTTAQGGGSASSSSAGTGTQVDPVITSPAAAAFTPFGVSTFPGGQGGVAAGGGMAWTSGRNNSPMGKAIEKMNQAKVALKKSSTDDEKKKADEQLTVALNEYFEADMVQRKKELADVKKRVEDLEKQLVKRETSKGDIVDLQKKVIVSEVNGLGFYGTSPNTVFGSGSASGYYSDAIRYPVAPLAPSAPASGTLQKR